MTDEGVEGSVPLNLNNRDRDNNAASRGGEEDDYEESCEEDGQPHGSRAATDGGSSTTVAGIDANPNVEEAVATKPLVVVVAATHGGEEAVAQA